MVMKTIAFICLLVGILEAAKCNSPIEIAAIVDVSDSLSPSDLPEIKNFLKRIGTTFNVSPFASHMSVILVGNDQARVAIGLQDLGANKNKFPNAVDNLKELGGPWSLYKGLSAVKERVFTIENGVRNFLPRIVVVITNGQQRNGDRDREHSYLQHEAKKLHDMGVHVYAVGVGDGVSRDELALMVKNESEHLYQADGFRDLDNLAVDMSDDMCKTHNPESLAVCNSSVDIGFIVDSSGSISDQGYINIQNFMKGISVYMGFKPGRTHIGVVLYSNRAELYTEFGKHANMKKLFRALWKMPHHQDVTRIDLGLHVANTQLFIKEAGMREDVDKIAILFTDGEQTTKGITDLMPLRETADKLRARGIVVYAVGIGENVKRDQLLDVAGVEENIFNLKSFSDLQESATKIALSTCQQVVGPPVINFTQSVYEAKESGKAVVGISVTERKVIAPLTVSVHPSVVTADDDDLFSTVQNVTFQPGETGPKFVKIDLVDDLRVEPKETFIVSLASSSSAILGEPSLVNINDDDVPTAPVINFTQPVYYAREYERKVKVGISVSDGVVSELVTVSITPSQGTAGKADFNGTVKEVTFQPGETGPKFVEIDVTDDLDVEPTETFIVSLSSVSPAALGGPSSVNIIDDEVPPPVINFTQPIYNVKESRNAVLVGILVTNGEVFETFTVSITPNADTADDDDDFDGTVKDVTFQPGETGPYFVEIIVVDDLNVEPTEIFTVSLSSASRAILGEPSSVNIIDDEVLPPAVINFTQPIYNVRESKKAIVGISVTDGKIYETVTVRITPKLGTAGEGDFFATVRQVAFQPGETGPKFVEFVVVDDLDVEPTEKFTVSLSSASRAVLGERASVYIIDDDGDNASPPVINFTQSVYNVNEEDRKAIVGISVTDSEVTKPVIVSISPKLDTAGKGDFVGTIEEVTFQPGETGPKFIEFVVVDDFYVEPTEKFIVSLSSASRAILGESASVNIMNNDVPPPVINFTQPIYNVNESKNAVVGISVTGGEISEPVTVRVTPNSDTAGDDDFDGTVKEVKFQTGETGPRFVEFDVHDDFYVEPTEKFIVSLSSDSRAVLGEPASVYIINDDVPPPVINFTQPIYNVRESKKAIVGISVTDGKIYETVTVRITPKLGTAGEGDFFATVRQVAFQPGETGPKFVEFVVVDDLDVEPTEKFTVSLSSASRAVLGERASVYIIDDDGDNASPPVINFTQSVYNVNEEDRKAIVGISVTDSEVTKPVIVSITPKLNTAGEGDFVGTIEEVTFQPGETGPKFIEFVVVDDFYVEPTEKFIVSLSSASRAILGESASVNIMNNDVPPPVINFTQPIYNVNESKNAVVGISVTGGEISEPVTVRVTPNSDTAGDYDFDGTVKEVKFQPGETGPRFVEFDVHDDFYVEPTEKFIVSLSSDSRAVLGEPASVYIINDDVPPPVINFTQPIYNVKEGKNVVVGISVTDGEIFEPVTVRVIPNSDTASDDDFDGTVKEVKFQPGETGPRFVEFNVHDDFYVEQKEKFTVSLSSDSRAVLGEPASVYIINGDVPPPVINFTQPIYNVKESKNAVVEISVTDGEISEPVTVRVIPYSDTASDEDFVGIVKEVKFQPGETGLKFVEIVVIDDFDVEPTEKFIVSLSSDSRAVLGEPASVYIINDDEPPLVINFTQPVYNVKESENAVVGIIVTGGNASDLLTVRITPNSGTADDDDYDGAVEEVIFQPGETGPKFVEIVVIDDFDVEPTETFTVSLTSDSRAVLGEPAAVYITNDDVPPICGTPLDDCHVNATCTDVKPGDYVCSCNAGYAGDGKFCTEIRVGFTNPVYNVKEDAKTVEVQLIVTSGQIISPVTVTVDTDPDSAGSTDFDSKTVEVTFQPGERGPKSVFFNVLDDREDEEDEKFQVSLSSQDPVSVDKPAFVNIIDNDESVICMTDKADCHPFANCEDTGPGLYKCTCMSGFSGDGKNCEVIAFSFKRPVYDVKENEKPVVEIQIASGRISEPVTVEVKTVNGKAGDEDFVPVTKHVTFQPGETKKTVEIDLIDDHVKNFTVALSSTSDVQFGSPTTVRIKDNDAQMCDLDIGFLLDSTASMRNCNFKKEKDFVKEIAGYFVVAPEATRTSTIVYGSESVLTKRFNDTKSLKDFQTDIDNISLKGGRANLNKAMHLAASAMFTVENGMRTNVPKVLVVLNDGAQKVITRSAKEISSMLRKSEVRVVVVGVGEADRDLLAQIVASPEDLIMVEKFEDAKGKLSTLFKRSCSTRDYSSCQILMQAVDLKIGGCVSEKPVEIAVCGGHCTSFSNLVKRNGVYELSCGCCKAKTKVTKTVLKCSMNTYQDFNIREAESCSCESCETNTINVQ